MNLESARVLITGGAKGIGNYVANDLLGKTSKVFVLDRDAELLNEIPDQPKLVKIKCDITDPKSVELEISEIFRTHGGANVCINNAGIIHSEPLINIISKDQRKHSLANWTNVINVNLNAVFYVASCFAENMVARKKGGVIINISSVSARGNVGQSAYAASKAAVEALSRTWSKELGMFKIRCVSLAPGFINTPSTRESLTDTMLEKWRKAVPLGRLGELSEISSAIRFIIEDDYFNGKTLSLDGGLVL
jgi:3-oxoacyl-[acyl-carrier protein] reductase